MRKGMAKGKGKGYKNIMGNDSRIHSQSAKGIRQPQKINPILNKVPKKLSFFEKSQIIDDIYNSEAEMSQAYLLSDDDSGVIGHRTGLPYYVEEGDINFDSNSGYQQREMNEAMERILNDVDLTLNDLKDDLEYSWNARSDSYLSFGTGETEMPDSNLPIFHDGSSQDAEIQIDNIKEEYEKHDFKKKGITFDDFKKTLEDDFNLEGDLIYSNVSYASVVSIPKKEFQKIIEETEKSFNKKDLDIINKYKVD